MTFFASDRERRLWMWSLAAVLAIYSTLIFSSLLSDVLYSQGLSAILFVTGMFLVGVTILTQGLKTRPGGVEIGIGIGIAVVYGMVFVRLSIPERSHLIEYGVVAVFIYEALRERASQGRRVPVPWLLAISLTTLIGAIDEFLQLFLPHRHFDKTDILFNFLAALATVIVLVVLGWSRRLTIHFRQKRQVDTKDNSGNE